VTTFEFRAVDQRGVELAGSIESASRAAVLRILDARGLVPLEISLEAATRHARLSTPNWWRLSPSRRLGARALMRFTQSLAALLAAGLTVDRALATVANVGQASAVRPLAKNLEKSVQAGQSLADAFAKSGQKLPSYYLSMVQAGEVSGTLPATLQRLADLQHRQVEIAERIRSALIYPLILAGVVLVTLIVLLAFVLPRFELMFAETDAAIPLSTRAVLRMIQFASHIGIQKAHITFPSPPKNIVFTVKGDSGIQSQFYLPSRTSQNLKIRICCSTIHIPWVGETIGRSPK
jgi:general secretion pathway protein F